MALEFLNKHSLLFSIISYFLTKTQSYCNCSVFTGKSVCGLECSQKHAVPFRAISVDLQGLTCYVN